MRGVQLCDLARSILGDRYDFAVQYVPNLGKLGLEAAWIALQPRGTVYIFVKDTVDRFSPEGLVRLRDRAAGTALDYIDRHLHLMPPQGIDLHVSASVSGVQAMKDRIARVSGTDEAIEGDVVRLLHGVDRRIHDLAKARQDRLRPVYLGSLHIPTIPPDIEQRMTILDATTTQKMTENFRAVAGHNFHYAVRQPKTWPGIRGRKPFTKGFTAAVLGANILTHADEDDALPLLGSTYPYMAPSTDHDAIRQVFARAERTFGGPEWQRALSQTARLAELVAPKAQAAELEAIVRRLLS
ncbi:MAG: hypothetical protein AAGA70_07795 [Pseudomonadota bacterium]